VHEAAVQAADKPAISRAVEALANETTILWNTVFPYLKGVGLAILYLVIGLIAIALIKRVLKRALSHSKKLEANAASFLLSTIDISLKVLLMIGIVSTLGIETSSIVAVLGAASLSIGIALQGSLSNFAAGVMLLIFRPFRVNDYIELNGIAGKVVDMNIFSTILNMHDNKKVVIPNSKLTGDSLINYSGNETRRIEIDVAVDYQSDIELVKRVLMQVITSHPKVLPEPAPLARLAKLGQSSMDFAVRAWVRTPDWYETLLDLNEMIKKALDSHKISIPYPHVTIVQKKTD